MASNKILKFYKGSTTPAGAAIGSIFFDTNTREIKVRVADSGDVQ